MEVMISMIPSIGAGVIQTKRPAKNGRLDLDPQHFQA
jgi:hypothetical protein